MVRSVAVFVIAAAVGALLGGCGEDTLGEGADDVLDGRTFLSTALTGYDLVGGTRVRLSFDAGTLSADAGCNRMTGDVEIVRDELRVEDLATTEMGCPPERHAQDEWLADFLTSRPSVSLDGDVLVLTSGAVVLTLVDRATVLPDRPLVGPRWVADTIIEGDVASSVPPVVEAWVQLDEERAEGHDGCNGFGASVEIDQDGAVIAFSGRTQTLKLCPDEVMRVAHAVVKVTNGGVAYEIDANRLTLTAEDGTAVSFTDRAN